MKVTYSRDELKEHIKSIIRDKFIKEGRENNSRTYDDSYVYESFVKNKDEIYETFAEQASQYIKESLSSKGNTSSTASKAQKPLSKNEFKLDNFKDVIKNFEDKNGRTPTIAERNKIAIENGLLDVSWVDDPGVLSELLKLRPTNSDTNKTQDDEEDLWGDDDDDMDVDDDNLDEGYKKIGNLLESDEEAEQSSNGLILDKEARQWQSKSPKTRGFIPGMILETVVDNVAFFVGTPKYLRDRQVAASGKKAFMSSGNYGSRVGVIYEVTHDDDNTHINVVGLTSNTLTFIPKIFGGGINEDGTYKNTKRSNGSFNDMENNENLLDVSKLLNLIKSKIEQ